MPSAAMGNGGVPHPVLVASVYLEITQAATSPTAICASVHFAGIEGEVQGVEFDVSIATFAVGTEPMARAVSGAVNMAITMTAYDKRAIKTTKGAKRNLRGK